MELSEKQINKFWDILKEHDNISRYSDSQKAEIANGIANFFIISGEISSKKQGNLLEELGDEQDSHATDPELRKERLVFNNLVEEVKNQFKLDIDSVHGLPHWKRVRHIGLYLRHDTGADFRVSLTYFLFCTILNERMMI